MQSLWAPGASADATTPRYPTPTARRSSPEPLGARPAAAPRAARRRPPYGADWRTTPWVTGRAPGGCAARRAAASARRCSSTPRAASSTASSARSWSGVRSSSSAIAALRFLARAVCRSPTRALQLIHALVGLRVTRKARQGRRARHIPGRKQAAHAVDTFAPARARVHLMTAGAEAARAAGAARGAPLVLRVERVLDQRRVGDGGLGALARNVQRARDRVVARLEVLAAARLAARELRPRRATARAQQRPAPGRALPLATPAPRRPLAAPASPGRRATSSCGALRRVRGGAIG